MHKDKCNLHPNSNFQQRQLFFSFFFKNWIAIFLRKQWFSEIATISYQGKSNGSRAWVGDLAVIILPDRLQNSSIPWQKAQKCSSTTNPETPRWLTRVQSTQILGGNNKGIKQDTDQPSRCNMAAQPGLQPQLLTLNFWHLAFCLAPRISFSSGLTCSWALRITIGVLRTQADHGIPMTKKKTAQGDFMFQHSWP